MTTPDPTTVGQAEAPFEQTPDWSIVAPSNSELLMQLKAATGSQLRATIPFLDREEN